MGYMISLRVVTSCFAVRPQNMAHGAGPSLGADSDLHINSH